MKENFKKSAIPDTQEAGPGTMQIQDLPRLQSLRLPWATQ